MLSRVADSLYWMSRYLERAEHTARLLDVNHEPDAGRGEHHAPSRSALAARAGVLWAIRRTAGVERRLLSADARR